MQNQTKTFEKYKQICKTEYEEYLKDDEAFFDKYSKLSINYLHFIIIGISSSFVLLQLPLNFYLVSNFIALSVLLFFIATTLTLRYFIKYKESKEVRLKVYEAWNKSILATLLINTFLIFVSNNGIIQFSIILFFLMLALIKNINKKNELNKIY